MAKYKYEIEYLPSFNKEFEETLYYIIYKLNNKVAAERQDYYIIKEILRN